MIPFKFAMAGRTRLTFAPFRTGPCRGSVRSHLFSLNTVQLDTGTHTHTFRWFPLEIPHLIQIALSLDCRAVKGLPLPRASPSVQLSGPGKVACSQILHTFACIFAFKSFDPPFSAAREKKQSDI